jgi:hypothetical protein
MVVMRTIHWEIATQRWQTVMPRVAASAHTSHAAARASANDAFKRLLGLAEGSPG